MFSRMEFIITETFISLRRHPMMAFAAITCVSATLFIAGLIALTFYNADNTVDTIMNQVRFRVFFRSDPETTREEARAAYRRLLQLPGVAKAEFIPRERQWEEFQKKDPEFARLLEKNYFPDAVEIKPRYLSDIPVLKKNLRQWPEVDQVRDAPGVSSLLERSKNVIRQVGIVLGGILLLLSLVIIHHTIELTLYARRKEIQIMSLVGATPGTVAIPFLLEGIFYGLLGGGLALVFLILLYHFAVIAMLHQHMTLLSSTVLVNRGAVALLVAGMALGFSGSMVSVFKYMHRPRSRQTNA